MEYAEITGDERFEKFKAELYKHVTDAVARGRRVKSDWYTEMGLDSPYYKDHACCPLGCHPVSYYNAPTVSYAVQLYDILPLEASDFQMGFEKDVATIPDSSYGRLGFWYRNQYP